jgi:hypothetical protein
MGKGQSFKKIYIIIIIKRKEKRHQSINNGPAAWNTV